MNRKRLIQETTFPMTNDNDFLMSTLRSVIPKLPSRDLKTTRTFYEEKLNLQKVGGDYPDYLMMMRDGIEIHFFLYPDLNPNENYGMVYIRVSNIEALYNELRNRNTPFPSAGHLQAKPWGQKEFAIIDPDTNLITFGEGI